MWKELKEDATKSTAAKISVSNKSEYLTIKKLDDTWTSTAVGFVTHWQEEARQLNELLPANEQFNDTVLKRMLENAVKPVEELAMIKNIDDNAITSGKNPMTYQQYSKSLLSAAAQRDDKLFRKSKNNRQHRKVNMSEMTESDYFDYGYIDGGEDFAEYDINVMSRNGRKGSEDAMRNYPTEFIPRRVWSELPKEYRDLITDYREKKKNESKSAKSFQANQTIMEDTVDDGVDEEPLDEDSNNQLELNETQLLACLANQKTAPKGTLSKLLNDSHSKKIKKKVNTVVPKESKYVTIDGVKYIREVNVTNVNYKISNRDFKIQKLVH